MMLLRLGNKELMDCRNNKHNSELKVQQAQKEAITKICDASC